MLLLLFRGTRGAGPVYTNAPAGPGFSRANAEGDARPAQASVHRDMSTTATRPASTAAGRPGTTTTRRH